MCVLTYPCWDVSKRRPGKGKIVNGNSVDRVYFNVNTRKSLDTHCSMFEITGLIYLKSI